MTRYKLIPLIIINMLGLFFITQTVQAAGPKVDTIATHFIVKNNTKAPITIFFYGKSVQNPRIPCDLPKETIQAGETFDNTLICSSLTETIDGYVKANPSYFTFDSPQGETVVPCKDWFSNSQISQVCKYEIDVLEFHGYSTIIAQGLHDTRFLIKNALNKPVTVYFYGMNKDNSWSYCRSRVILDNSVPPPGTLPWTTIAAGATYDNTFFCPVMIMPSYPEGTTLIEGGSASLATTREEYPYYPDSVGGVAQSFGGILNNKEPVIPSRGLQCIIENRGYPIFGTCPSN